MTEMEKEGKRGGMREEREWEGKGSNKGRKTHAE